MTRRISRRQFVGEASAAAVGAGLLLGPAGALAKGAPAKSKVVQVTHTAAVTKERKVDAAAVREMLRQGLKALLGGEQPLKQLFTSTDRVGLKINCLGMRRIYTHHELVEAWAAELQAVGIPAQNIVVWDRFEDHMKDCGYEMKPEGPGVRCMGTEDRTSDLDRSYPKVRYSSRRDSAEGRHKGSTTSRLSRLFTKECDKVVNLAILKDHGLSGVTLTLKNLAFGLCTNNRRFHSRDAIGPFIAGFCARPDVKSKVVLHVIDGLEGCFDGGPRPASEDSLFRPQTLWLGADPVALDRLGADAIEEQRRSKGLPSLAKDGRDPRHIRLAAQAGVGTDDPKRIELVKVALG